jgi:hypothetical protein
MPTPPKPREDYSKEVADLAKLRRLVKVDELRGNKWKSRADSAVEALINLLIQSPKQNATSPEKA